MLGMPRRPWLALIGALVLAPAAGEPPPPPDVPLGAPGPFDGVAAPALIAAIVDSRDTAIREGVTPIPRAVRAALTGYVPEPVLDRVRFRVGGGSWLSLQRNLIGFGYAPAVTLDYVIVFETAADARDPKLWVHELRHVEQFMLFGVDGFAKRYIANYSALEVDAAEYRWTWMKQTGRVPKPL